MATSPRELQDALAERRYTSDRILDEFGGLREKYSDWKDRGSTLDTIIAGDWDVIWPDLSRTMSLPKVPNLVVIACEHRSRQAAAVWPSMMCPAEGIGDKNRIAAERRERILAGYHYMARTRLNVPMWANDAMLQGISVVKVLPEFEKPKAQRYPKFERIDPRYCYPSPVFTHGPFVDDMIVSYQEKVRTLMERFPKAEIADWLKTGRKGAANPKMVEVIEWYGPKDIGVICKPIYDNPNTAKEFLELLPMTEHKLGRCPIAIGVRPTPDGIYRSDFDSLLAVLNTWNRMMTMELDSAALNIYPERVIDASEIDMDKADFGPDGTIPKSGSKPISEVYQYIQRPGAPFSMYQDMRLLSEFARVGALLPPSLTGDPNESIISAAGVSATQTMPNDHVRNLQTHVLSPMLEAANELAFEVDEKWCNTDKEIFGEVRGRSFRERYNPERDIDGHYRNRVDYGPFAGVTPENTNVMTLQQWNGGNGIISRRRAMELSPFVDNPIETEKQIVKERLVEAELAGVIAKAATGELSPQQVAEIDRALDDNKMTLRDAILKAAPQQPFPVAQPQGVGIPSTPESPGMAGAGEPNIPQQQLPSLESLLPAGRR